MVEGGDDFEKIVEKINEFAEEQRVLDEEAEEHDETAKVISEMLGEARTSEGTKDSDENGEVTKKSEGMSVIPGQAERPTDALSGFATLDFESDPIERMGDPKAAEAQYELGPYHPPVDQLSLIMAEDAPEVFPEGTTEDYRPLFSVLSELQPEHATGTQSISTADDQPES